MIKQRMRILALAAALAVAGSAFGADDTSSRKARVAGGVIVKVAKSDLSDAEIAKLRPNMRDLIPKKR